MGSTPNQFGASEFETCPGWGAKFFKHLQTKNSTQIPLFGQTVGTFVGMLFQNSGHSFAIEIPNL
jgi:hypothetical protein